MQYFKFPKGTILLITITALLAISSVHPDNDKIVNPKKPINKSLADVQEQRLYNFHKKILSDELESYFENAIKNGDILGVGVSITKGDSILIADGFGKRTYGKDEEVDGGTVFRLGSLSKGFTGVLAANLKSEGKIDWDDDLVDYIPEFKLGDKASLAPIKISHILSHTTGIPYHSYTNLVEAGLPMSKITKAFADVQPISEPGIQYSYQNAMFALSQEVMLKATGKNIQELLSNRIFKPLGMSKVTTDHNSLLEFDNIASPHRKYRKGWREIRLTDRYDNAVAAGGINASSMDMAKWMRFLLGHNPKVMSPNAIQEVFKPFISFKNKNKYYQKWPGHVASSYGYGWRIHSFKSEETGELETIWHHGGSVNNYRNEIALFPESDLGICVLINSNSKLARNVIPDLRAIVKRVYDQQPATLAIL